MQQQEQPRDMTFIGHGWTDKPVWYLHPDRTHLVLEDFRSSLENICRYNGGIKWTLIRHLALGVLLARDYYRTNPNLISIAGYYAAHDLHECIVGDVVSGMKKYLPNFQVIEDQWEIHVHNCIGLPIHECTNRKEVKTLDLLALVTEMTMLNHPAAPIVIKSVGLTPDKRDCGLFNCVRNMTDDECWWHISKAIQAARNVNGSNENQSTEQNRDRTT
jgi:hypothetical protein